jgi:short-subunit dehydrogenase
MEAISDALRQELRPWGIHVALVEPGSIATEIWQKGQNDATEFEKNMPEEGTMRYRKAFAALRVAARKFEEAGIPPDRVARAVEHALTAGRPRTRYIVGFDATVQRILRDVVPDRMRDGIVARQLGLPTKP